MVNTRSALVRIVLALASTLSMLAGCDMPRPTPVPTAIPVPSQPPRVIRLEPERGQEHQVDRPIRITFDQPMDKAAAERAWTTEPEIPGRFTWEGSTLSFEPDEPGFQRATSYRVVIQSSARSTSGLSLVEPFVLEFRTVGYLEVTSVQPAPGTVDVSPDAVLTVVFNQPVVPVTAVSDINGPQPLTFEPAIEGSGRWLNTSIYTFRADPALVPGTTYRATVEPERLAESTEAVMAEAYVWEFITALPEVVSVTTADPEGYIGPSPTISVTFNMKMDHGDIEDRLTLVAEETGRAMPVTFAWESSTVSLRPVVPLALDAPHRLQLTSGARAAFGGKGMQEEFEWPFRTVGAPRVLFTTPPDGGTAEAYTSLQIVFSNPMNPHSLAPHLTILPEPTDIYTGWVESDTQVYVSFGAKPSTTYTVTLDADMQDRYGSPLDEPYRIRFTTMPLSPSIYLPPGRVATYSAYTTTAIHVQHVNIAQLDVTLYRLQRSAFLLLNGQDWWKYWDNFPPRRADLMRKWTVKVDSSLDQYVVTDIPLSEDRKSALRAGFYYVEVRAPDVVPIQKHMLVVSQYNLSLKVGQMDALAWVTDLSSGQPVAGLDVTVFGPAGEIMGTGRTDGAGIVVTDLETEGERDPWTPVIAIAGPDESPAAASTDWADGIAPWEFGLSSELYMQRHRVYVYTDRVIYRPGQTVFFKGIIRADDDGKYSLPVQIPQAKVVAYDDQGNQFYQTDLPVSDMGSVHGEFQISEEAGLGYYTLNIEIGERSFGTGFRVAEYRKPEFVVALSTDATEYTQGDDILVAVDATYFFGGPVADATVNWRVMRQDYYFSPPKSARAGSSQRQYTFSDADYEDRERQTAYGELVTTGQGKTDASGSFVLTLPADIADKKNSQILTIEASITDPSNQEVSGRNSMVVHKGAFYVGLAPQDYIGTVGQKSKVGILTVAPSGDPIGNQPLSVVVAHLEWYNVQEQADDGRFYWQWKVRETPTFTTTLTTDAEGNAVADFTPERGGSYRVRAVGRDERGNEIRSSTYLWVSSMEFVSWQQSNNDRIELVTDQKTYEPGDSARLLIPSPFQGPVKALLTVERGRIRSHQVLTLRSNSDQVSVPITAEYAPNAYLSVVIVKGTDITNAVPAYRVGYAKIAVSTAQTELSVDIVPDSTDPYEPRSKAAFDLRATDHAGRGVQAEFSLQLVDAAILALTNGGQGTMLNQFYGERGLGVQTGATLAISMDRYRLQARPPTAKGGSGGLEDSEVIRKRFLDTAYWNADVRTDAEGKARVVIDLPDNLTTWRATAKGITADTLVGEGTAEIVTSKDLMVRAVAPRFFVLGDELQLGAVVHNSTDQAVTADVSLQAEGLTVEGGPQQVTVPAGGSDTVGWQARAVTVGTATLTWRAAAGDLSDALELTLPVYHYSTPETVATSGQIPAGEARVETVILPGRLDASQGALTMQLAPSLAASMRDGLQYLEQYPYECIEQTVSRFLPNVLTYRALQKLGTSDTQAQSRLSQYVSVALQRLYAMQHYDGGWGWWLADPSNPFITAYAVLGMLEAARAGFAVDTDVVGRAVQYLQETLTESGKIASFSANMRAFLLYVLAEYGEGDMGRTVALFDTRNSLSTYGKACLLMALHILEAEQGTRAKTLLSELNNVAVLSASGAHWEEESADYETMNTDTRTTAIVLAALVRADPANGLIPNTVRWLMSTREEGHWRTTQETAWSIMALSDFVSSTGELQADYDYRVSINGQPLGQWTVTAQDLGSTRELEVAVQDLLQATANRVLFERFAPHADQTGQGQLYYALYLRYYLPAEEVRALSRGIHVLRQYELLDVPGKPLNAVRLGDVVRVKLTIVAPNDVHYLVVEDPLPAGCEALDVSLRTTSAAYQGPGLILQGVQEPYWCCFTETELRDEKAVLFATYLTKGTYEYSYLIRASIPGRFLAMPATAYEMYFPEVFGRSDGAAFTISE